MFRLRPFGVYPLRVMRCFPICDLMGFTIHHCKSGCTFCERPSCRMLEKMWEHDGSIYSIWVPFCHQVFPERRVRRFDFSKPLKFYPLQNRKKTKFSNAEDKYFINVLRRQQLGMCTMCTPFRVHVPWKQLQHRPS